MTCLIHRVHHLYLTLNPGIMMLVLQSSHNVGLLLLQVQIVFCRRSSTYSHIQRATKSSQERLSLGEAITRSGLWLVALAGLDGQGLDGCLDFVGKRRSHVFHPIIPTTIARLAKP